LSRTVLAGPARTHRGPPPLVICASLGCFAATGLGLTGCRGEVDPFTATEREPVSGEAVRLTFNEGDDRTPAWSVDGDSIYYSAEDLQGFGRQPGLLVGVPREGGSATPLLRNVQDPDATARWLLAPAISPNQESIAFAEVAKTWPDYLPGCPGGTPAVLCTPITPALTLPPLREVILRVRGIDATGPVDADPALSFQARGVSIDLVNFPYNHVLQVFPFQQVFADEGTPVFRPSWSPDADKLVYSDGLGLRIWTIAEDRVDVIRGTEDGVSPAWSPDGSWILFTRLERADSMTAICEIYTPLPPPTLTCVVERTDYTIGRRALNRVRPDGSELQVIGEGEDPAWGPDGMEIFFRLDNAIWRSAADGSGAVQVPGTNRGREPSVSPDGRFLAFSTLGERGDYDIWVIRLE
jgi:hypothetical protein